MRAFAWIVWVVAASVAAQEEAAPKAPRSAAVPADGELNAYVLEVIERYPTDGTHAYYWPRSGPESRWRGCTKDLEYGDDVLCEGDPDHRAYCCGLTFEVFLDAWKLWCERTHRPWRIRDLSLADVRRLQSQWFGSAEDHSCMRTALVANDLGYQVEDLADARPGDFVQLWRSNGSGHSVVFLGWQRDGDRVTGIRYWSTQRSTDGIGERTERFADDDHAGVLRDQIYICRVGLPPAKPNRH